MLKVSTSAAEDLRYLLERGYGRASAVKFVGDKYTLDNPQRLLLYRCVYPIDSAQAHQGKLIDPSEIGKYNFSIDGFNVLWTINSALNGRPIIFSDDHFVRDISIAKGEPSVCIFYEAIKLVMQAISSLNPIFSSFIFDRPISQSGEISSKVREALAASSLKGSAITSPNADADVLMTNGIIASSDSIIIDKAIHVFDLGGYVIKEILRIDPIKI
jgi:hypothetical protein